MRTTALARFIVAAYGLAATACGGGAAERETATPTPREAATYTVVMDAPSPEDRVAAFTQFFPAVMRVHAGDSIRFVHDGTKAPHTVTLGVASDRSDQPLWDPTPDGFSTSNVVVEGTCITPEESDPSWTTCPSDAVYSFDDLPAYAGDGFWNSGLVLPGNEVEVGIDLGTAPGSYPFLCLIHPAMSGLLEVVADDADADSPAEIEEQGRSAQQRMLAAGVPEVPAPEPIGLGKATVAAGTVIGPIQVDEFTPAEIEIEAGDTVTWQFSYVHSVTFARTELDPTGGDWNFPAGAPSGSLFGDEGAHSGFILETSTDPTFTLRFETPGVFEYSCLLHPGMRGTVRVR